MERTEHLIGWRARDRSGLIKPPLELFSILAGVAESFSAGRAAAEFLCILHGPQLKARGVSVPCMALAPDLEL